MNLSRRTFVGGLIAAVSAPSIVQAQSLMPVKVLKPCGPLIVHVDRVIHYGRKTFPTIQDAVDYIAAMGSGIARNGGSVIGSRIISESGL